MEEYSSELSETKHKLISKYLQRLIVFKYLYQDIVNFDHLFDYVMFGILWGGVYDILSVIGHILR